MQEDSGIEYIETKKNPRLIHVKNKIMIRLIRRTIKKYLLLKMLMLAWGSVNQQIVKTHHHGNKNNLLFWLNHDLIL